MLSVLFTHWNDTSISSVTYNRAGQVSKSAVVRGRDVGFIDHFVSTTYKDDPPTPAYRTHHYRLRWHDGTRIKGWTTWATLFEKKRLPFLLAQIRAMYQSGQPLSFGVLGLSQEGIRYRDRLLPWRDLQSLKFDEETGTITLESIPQPGKTLSRHRPWASIYVGQVPNFRVVSLLVQEIKAAVHP